MINFSLNPAKIRTPLITALLTASVMTPGFSHAKGIVCEEGIIKIMQFRSGGISSLKISTGGGVDTVSAREKIGKDYFTILVKNDDDIRWRDRVSLLRSAYALQAPVIVRANDDSDCDSYSDEFTITLCRPGKC